MKHAINIIGELRKGSCNEELSEAIATATERVKATGKKARVTLILDIEPAGVQKDDRTSAVERVWVTDEVKVTLPKMPKEQTYFFIDPDNNNLTRQDPQRVIPGVKTA